jgi:hypothetical protein
MADELKRELEQARALLKEVMPRGDQGELYERITRYLYPPFDQHGATYYVTYQPSTRSRTES